MADGNSTTATSDYLNQPIRTEAEARALLTARTCPHCGQLTPQLDKLGVDLDRNDVVAFGRRIHLRPTEAEIFYVLLRRAPRLVSSESLIQAIAPVHGMDDNNLKVHICRLRQKLQGLPWTIRNIHSVGYILTDAPPDQLVKLPPPPPADTFDARPDGAKLTSGLLAWAKGLDNV